MKVTFIKVLALCGLCALCAGAGSTAFAQGFDHRDRDFDHRPMRGDIRMQIQNLQHEYAHDMHVGNYSAARRAHWRAQQLREHLRDRRDFR